MRGIGNKIDKPLLIILAAIVVAGFFIFLSASLGLLAGKLISVKSILFGQLVLGIGLGSVALIVMSRIHYRFLKRYAPHIFIATMLLTLLVFIPGLGFSSGGARRWISLGFTSVQPAELLKIGTILFLAAYLSQFRNKLSEYKYGVLAFMAILAIPALLLLLQPDTSTIVVITLSAVGMFFVVGARWRDIGVLFLSGILVLGMLVIVRPYILERMLTFIHPTVNQEGTGYQIKQSLIAVGSGEAFGRGFGQSVQKFGYLPEPIGDSIFAVAAEEFGFAGSFVILGLFLALVTRSFWLAARAPDYFGGLLIIGLSLLITTQVIINIASMLRVIPLTGLPLPFISHGGTALFVMLASMGIILNISRYSK